MFKKVTKIALAGIIGVGTMVGSSSFASADTKATYDSKAKIQFDENTDFTPPVDPSDPTVDVDPGELPDQGTAGPLSIDYVSNFNFGHFRTTSSAAEYTALPVTVTPKAGEEGPKSVAPYAQVTDNRASNSGWKLSVAQDGQLSTTNPAVEDAVLLKGAKITIGQGKTVGTLTQEISTFDDDEVELKLDGEMTPIFGTKNETIGGTFVNSFSSIEASNEADSIKNINVKLIIPEGTAMVAEEYTTDLNWTLEDVPFDEALD